MSEKLYLGDGAYAAFDGLDVELTTDNGHRVTNRICLESDVLSVFLRWLPQHYDLNRLIRTMKSSDKTPIVLVGGDGSKKEWPVVAEIIKSRALEEFCRIGVDEGNSGEKRAAEFVNELHELIDPPVESKEVIELKARLVRAKMSAETMLGMGDVGEFAEKQIEILNGKIGVR